MSFIKLFVGMFIIAIIVSLLFPPYYGMAKRLPIAELTDTELFDTFVENPVDAQSRFGHKVILLEGRISSIDNKMIIMGSGMRVVRIILQKQAFKKPPGFDVGQRLVVKGLCSGIDLNEIIVTHAIIVSVRN
ncbi:MAG: hypothetical protein J7L96_10045 [Bacteroidales bacterium]|nr:hypothetical protein [Bacteroidales bacterium]